MVCARFCVRSLCTPFIVILFSNVLSTSMPLHASFPSLISPPSLSLSLFLSLPLPSQRYIRVVGGILNTDPHAITEHMAMQANSRLDRIDGSVTERGKKRFINKLNSRKDSFFHLQNNIVKKSGERDEIKRAFRKLLIYIFGSFS